MIAICPDDIDGTIIVMTVVIMTITIIASSQIVVHHSDQSDG